MVSTRNSRGRACPLHTAPLRPRCRVCPRCSGSGAGCRHPFLGDCLGQPSGWASDCRGRPWRRAPRGRTQTCTRTSHRQPRRPKEEKQTQLSGWANALGRYQQLKNMFSRGAYEEMCFYLLHDSFLVVVTQRPAQLVVVHCWSVFLDAPTPCHLK